MKAKINPVSGGNLVTLSQKNKKKMPFQECIEIQYHWQFHFLHGAKANPIPDPKPETLHCKLNHVVINI